MDREPDILCRDCSAPLPKPKKRGRPRVICQECSDAARVRRRKARKHNTNGKPLARSDVSSASRAVLPRSGPPQVSHSEIAPAWRPLPTAQEVRFAVLLVVEGLTVEDAAVRVGMAANAGKALARRSSIAGLIEELRQASAAAAGVTRDRVVATHADIAWNQPHASVVDRQRSLDSLADLLGYKQPSRQEITVSHVQRLSDAELDAEAERLGKLIDVTPTKAAEGPSDQGPNTTSSMLSLESPGQYQGETQHVVGQPPEPEEKPGA